MRIKKWNVPSDDDGKNLRVVLTRMQYINQRKGADEAQSDTQVIVHAMMQ